jgi:hypothetical protein
MVDDLEESRRADYVARVASSAGDSEVEKLAWAICPYLSDEFDYPRLPLPVCEKCEWVPGQLVRGCRHIAQQAALAVRVI